MGTDRSGCAHIYLVLSRSRPILQQNFEHAMLLAKSRWLVKDSGTPILFKEEEQIGNASVLG
jgi:hypothetical protein